VRWRVARSRRSRLTSIGSATSASGPVDEGVQHLVVARGAHVEQLADGRLLGAGVLPPLALEGQDLGLPLGEPGAGAGADGDCEALDEPLIDPPWAGTSTKSHGCDSAPGHESTGARGSEDGAAVYG
jgi:hypothetical protein